MAALPSDTETESVNLLEQLTAVLVLSIFGIFVQWVHPFIYMLLRPELRMFVWLFLGMITLHVITALLIMLAPQIGRELLVKTIAYGLRMSVEVMYLFLVPALCWKVVTEIVRDREQGTAEILGEL